MPHLTGMFDEGGTTAKRPPPCIDISNIMSTPGLAVGRLSPFK